MDEEDQEYIKQITSEVNQGGELEIEQVRQLLDIGDQVSNSSTLYDICVRGYQNNREFEDEDILGLYELVSYAKHHGIDAERSEEMIDSIFEDMDTSEERMERRERGIDGPVTAVDAEEALDYLEDDWEELKEIAKEKGEVLQDRRLRRKKKTYLLSIRRSFERYV
ncbi:hypothetical protein [Halogeometricum sp. CBA1124]|uniref:hypothetical protein n=1 Tax=Halogeometricum sp. CBA1124 TaxID=2668071 RepID=UPI00142CE5F4|nr:hypothetical protein [Halogeometricum sp. CBA1124]MUV56083.1 hypothetical protein [Halogeometricum sp. CBA1124]